MLVSDNGSTDGTLDLLHDLARRGSRARRHGRGAALLPGRQDDPAGRRRARRRGGAGSCPSTPTGSWFAAGVPLTDRLRATREGLVRARLFNAYPYGAGDRWRLDLTPHHLGKVAIRAHWAARLGVGNHTASHPGEHAGERTGGLYIAHFPWRSAAQLRRKGTQGGAALTADQVARGLGTHWARFPRRGGHLDGAGVERRPRGPGPPRPVVVTRRAVPGRGPA